MNILFIAKNIPIPGRTTANKIIYTIGEQLIKHRGYSIDLFTPKSIVPWGFQFFSKKYKSLYKLPDWTIGGIDVYPIPFIHLPKLRYAYWLFNRLPQRAKCLFEQNNYDLIHAHYGMPDGYLAYLLSQRYEVPYVVTVRSHDLRHLRKLHKYNPDFVKYERVLANASKICVLNSYVKDVLRDLGFESQILPHGIDPISQPIQLPRVDEAISITCVAQYLKRKNIEWVIDACLVHEGQQTFDLSIVGDMEDMPDVYKDKCSAANIHLVGKLPYEQVLSLLSKSDVFVLPSVLETFGLVYIEAAMTRNAIIGHHNEGVCGVFSDDEMYFAKDDNDFEQKLHRLIDDETLRLQLKDKAYARAQDLTWDKVCAMYGEVYSELIPR